MVSETALTSTGVLARIKKEWHRFKGLPPGRRFQAIHEAQSGAPVWVKVVLVAAAIVALGVGVVLTILPGPAFVFYGVAGALVATESAWVARTMDSIEVAARELIAKLRRRARRVKRSL